MLWWLGVAFVASSLPAAIFFWFREARRADAIAARYARQQRAAKARQGTDARFFRR